MRACHSRYKLINDCLDGCTVIHADNNVPYLLDATAALICSGMVLNLSTFLQLPLGTVSLAPTVSNKRHDYCLSSFSVSDSTLHDYEYSLRGALQCIAQANTTLLDRILYQMQYLHDPGILPSSAN